MVNTATGTHLRKHLLRRERWCTFKALLLMLPAIPSTIVASALACGGLALVLLFFRLRIPLPLLIVLSFAVGIGWLVWTSRRSSSAPNSDLWSLGTPAADPIYTIPIGRRSNSAGLGYNFVIFRPSYQHLREAIGMLQVASVLNSVDRNQVEQLLLRLRLLDHGLYVRQIREEGEPTESALRLIAYLRFYGWIGSSPDGEHIWLSSDARALLDRIVLTEDAASQAAAQSASPPIGRDGHGRER
jgi:hypothetical protein